MKRHWAAIVVIVIAAFAFNGVLRAEQPAPPAKPAKPVKPAAPREIKLPAGVRADRDVKYGPAAGRANLLDVYYPENATDKRPLVIWVHGGGWSMGDKAGCPGVAMVPLGYVAASINYRFSQEAIYPAQLDDCKAAIRWLRAHADQYHIDPTRVGVWGSSAGGHLVALLGATSGVKEMEGTVGSNLDQSSAVQAVCDLFGPSDMSVFFKQAGDENIFKGDPLKSPICKLFGGAVEERKDLVAKGNPITFISKNTPPFLILHGDKDKLVPLAQSQMLQDALKAAGVESHLEVLQGSGHGGPGFGSPAILKLTADFFAKHLHPAAPTDK